MSITDEQLGRIAYEEFQRQVGADPARSSWSDLPKINKAAGVRTQQQWIEIAKAIVAAVKVVEVKP